MATYAVGDIQGCYLEFLDLLRLVEFRAEKDRLWSVGDLVSEGPRSLEVLRLAYELNASATLGNHDLNLLAAAHGISSAKTGATDVLEAPDREVLIDWLRRQPLAHHNSDLGYLLVHAGVPPQWTVEETVARAEEVSRVLSGPECGAFLEHVYNNPLPDKWEEDLEGWDRLGFTVNALAFMRYVTPDGSIDVKCVLPPGKQPDGLMPWYEHPSRRSSDTTVTFGHWASLYDVFPIAPRFNVAPLDTACVFGHYLTALRLEDRHPFSVRAQKAYKVPRHKRGGN